MTATFFAMRPLAEGSDGLGEMRLDDLAAHHAHVRRLSVGDPVAVTNGIGFRWSGRVSALNKRELVATMDHFEQPPEPPHLHLYVPVADRDRMLWLAEKATELQVTSWTPVMYRRSKSVAPRGDGEAFGRKLFARMVAALEQSEGAWLPRVHQMLDPSHVRSPDGSPCVVLERGGPGFGSHRSVTSGVSIAVGPEGGFEPDELTTLRDAGWQVGSLGSTTLRFETAAVAALAIARDALEREQGR